MKILKLLVASVLMSAMLISCTSEDATTTTATPDATASTPAVEETPAVDETATEEVADEATTEGEGEVDADGTAPEMNISWNADMTDEEITEAYANDIAAMVEAGDLEQEVADMMISIFDPAVLRAQLEGAEVDTDAIVDELAEDAATEEATEEEATEEAAETAGE